VRHAARTSDGGVVIAWIGTCHRSNVEARIAGVLRSLQSSN